MITSWWMLSLLSPSWSLEQICRDPRWGEILLQSQQHPFHAIHTLLSLSEASNSSDSDCLMTGSPRGDLFPIACLVNRHHIDIHSHGQINRQSLQLQILPLLGSLAPSGTQGGLEPLPMVCRCQYFSINQHCWICEIITPVSTHQWCQENTKRRF